jgi:hypothetical protein
MSALTDWLQAVGTIGAFGGVLYEFRRRRRDDERTAAERRDSESRQARLITTKVVASGWQDSAATELTLEVHNQSHDAISSVGGAIDVYGDGGRSLHIGIVGGGTVGKATLRLVHPLRQTSSTPFDADAFQRSVTFLDDRGLLWTIRGTHRPIRSLDESANDPRSAFPKRRLRDVWRRFG